MPSVTATQVLTDAFQTLNVYQPGDTIATADSTTGLRFLNLMLGQWAQQGLTIPAISSLTFALLSGKGSSTNPYTIGTGGDLNTPRPPNQNSIVGAGLLLNSSTPPVEIPRMLLTNDAYGEIRIKDLAGVLFTGVHYRPLFAGDLGQIFLWPVPTDLTNNLVLYIKAAISTFADLTTSYSVPPGYDEALYLNLAKRIARPFGRPVENDLREDAAMSLAIVKRSNLQLSDLTNDFAQIGVGHTRRGYNLNTGE
jgi:hypothetical protein